MTDLALAGVAHLPKIVNNEVGVKERGEMYLEGGVMSITSRILVVDMLAKRFPTENVDLVIVNHAHRINETSLEAFVLELYRKSNKVPFLCVCVGVCVCVRVAVSRRMPSYAERTRPRLFGSARRARVRVRQTGQDDAASLGEKGASSAEVSCQRPRIAGQACARHCGNVRFFVLHTFCSRLSNQKTGASQ